MEGDVGGKRETIGRDALREIVEASLPEGCAESTKAKLRAVAETTDAVAVGWFHSDGVTCPARQAGRANMAFQETFDRAMGKRFGREWDDDSYFPFLPFVVRIEPEGAAPRGGAHKQKAPRRNRATGPANAVNDPPSPSSSVGGGPGGGER
jgi:hypothetical protein